MPDTATTQEGELEAPSDPGILAADHPFVVSTELGIFTDPLELKERDDLTVAAAMKEAK